MRQALTEAIIISALDAELGDSYEYRKPQWGRGIGTALHELSGPAWERRLEPEGCNDLRDIAAIVPARTDTAWWWKYCRPWEVRFLRGRVKFGRHTSGAPFPSAIVLMGPGAEREVVKWWEPRGNG